MASAAALKFRKPPEHYGPLGTAQEERERLCAAFAEEDALQERVDELTARYASLLSIAEELAEALRYIEGKDVAGYDAHMRPEEVARQALARYSNLHKGEHDG